MLQKTYFRQRKEIYPKKSWEREKWKSALSITFGAGWVHFLAIPFKVSCGIFIVLRQFNNKFGFIWAIFCWFWNLEWSKIFLVQGLRDIDWLSLNKIINCFDWIKLPIAWTNQYRTSLDELGFKIICSKLGWSLIFKKDKHLKEVQTYYKCIY